MAIAPNTVNDRLPGKGPEDNPTDTAKQNYNEVGWGNDKGSVRMGHIHKQGDVTAGVILQTPDAEHQLSLDIDGQRKGWTVATGPGAFNVECGSAMEEAQDSLILNAKNGNICITATNGKIRLQATDIELVAVGEGGSKGNIRIDATETIQMNSKKQFFNSVIMFRISTIGIGEISANTVLTMYGSMIRGVTDAVYHKDSKVGGQFIQRLNNILTAVNIFAN